MERSISPRLMTPRPASARPEMLVERFLQRQAMYGYNTKSLRERGQPTNAHQWWEYHVLKTNVNRAVNQPLGYSAPRSPRAVSPRAVSPRHSLQSAGGLSRRGKMSYYPPYAPHLEKPAKPLTPEAVEAAPAPEAVEVQEYHRKHGELPPGVTPQDLQKVQMTLKDRLTEKYSSLRGAFQAIDFDRSGVITIDELWKSLETLNLHTIRKEVIEVFFELIDCDESGGFDFKEFLRVMNASDVMSMGQIASKRDTYAEQKAMREAEEQAAKSAEAARMGMTLEEFEAYWDSVPKSAFGQMTSEEMAQVVR